jgi:uncharacterized protein (TIGR02145 family)
MEEILIGDQIWMAENLKVDTFRNGDPIIHASTFESWEKSSKYGGSPAWCHYDDDPANDSKYGKLYNWYAVNDPRGLAPEGWRIPACHEWQTLIEYLSGENEAGSKMKSTIGWIEDGNGTNESGFSAVPGGFRKWYGSFNFHERGETIGQIAMWWSYAEKDMNSAWYFYVMNNLYNVIRNSGNKGMGLSIRCIKE